MSATPWARARQLFEARYVERTPQSKALFERAQARMPGGVPGNAGYRDPHPLYIASAQGKTVTDVDGNEYLDLLIGGGPHILGHCPPAVTAAVIEQLVRGTSALAPSEDALELAELIHRHMPHVESLRYTATGSEATHMAMRAARAYTGRNRIAKFEGHFHGGYDNHLISGRAYAGEASRPDAIPDGAGIPPRIAEDTLVLPFNDADGAVALIEEHADELAAVIVEPVAGTWMGGIAAEVPFLEAVRAATERHGVLLIYDEIVTGFRMSLGGAAAVTGVVPDLTALGKIIGGGFPMGAFGGRREIMDHVLAPARSPEEQAHKIFHSGTFQNNLISLRAGIALLRELEQPGVLDRINALGDRLRAGVERIGERLGLPIQTTGYGSIVGIHFAEAPIRNLRDLLASDRDAVGTFCLGMVASGLFITTYHLALTNGAQDEGDIDRVLEIADQVLTTMVAERQAVGV